MHSLPTAFDRRQDAIVVMDLETSNDPYGTMILQGRRTGRQTAAIQRLRSAAILVARGMATGGGPTISIHGFHGSEEDLLLEAIADVLDPLAEDGALMVTFNGRRHDLPILRRRAGHHMLFGRVGLTAWCGGTAKAIDLMNDLYWTPGNWPSLAQVCAGYGIAIPEIAGRSDIPLHLRKAEQDVAATFVAFLFERALTNRDGQSFMAAWSSLARTIQEGGDRLSHLIGLERPARLQAKLP